MATPAYLANMVRIRTRFARSVNLELDFYNDTQTDGYILTSLARGTLRRIAEGFTQVRGSRAWTLTGPYGSGKSAFALFLASVLADAPGATSQLKRDFNDVWQLLFDQRKKTALPPGRYLPVLVTGSREPVGTCVLRGCVKGLNYLNSPTARARAQELEKMLQGPSPSDRDVLSAVEVTSKLLRESDEAVGVLLVIDELGKHLEFSAVSPDRGDLYLLQAFAELAQRSIHRFLVITLLHQSFERYAERLTALERNEWSKVQGRFEDVAFQESPDQNLRLIAGAIEFCGQESAHIAWTRDSLELSEKTVELGLAPTNLLASEFSLILSETAPLHPTVALILGPLFRRLAQNERSLFAFLSAFEPHGFQDFLVTQPWTGGVVPRYTIDRLYDYLAASMGTALYRATLGSRWAEVESAMERLAEHEVLDNRLVKAIAVLALVGAQARIRANVGFLAFALDADPRGVSEALQRLCEKSILVYRSFKDAYALWEGSDFDVEARLDHARGQVQLEEGVAALLARERPIRPLVARRHSIQKGVLRYFEVGYAELDKPVELPANQDADGQIIYLFASPGGGKDRLQDWLLHYSERPETLLVVPESTPVLAGILLDLSCFRWIYKNSPELAGDPVARRELQTRLGEIQASLRIYLDSLLDNSSRTGRWYRQGKQIRIGSRRELTELLSTVADQVYSSSPLLPNELINRRHLSSAGAAARRSLLDAMLSRSTIKGLGFTGHPPERSIYEALLERSGLHRLEGEQWGFYPPLDGAKEGLHFVWDAIDDCLADTEASRVSVADIFDRLARPPLGLKAGPMPVLLAAYLLQNESEVAVYEQGAFLPEVSISNYERLIKHPENFRLQRFRVAGVRADVFRRLCDLVSNADASGRVDLLTVVRPLMTFVAGLPGYSRVTQTVSTLTARLRKALLEAVDPAHLLFNQLPEACELKPFNEEEQPSTLADQFVQNIKQGLKELQLVYSRLLESVESELYQALDVVDRGESARHNLLSRCTPLQSLTVEDQFKGVLVRFVDDRLDRELWVESVATVLASKPPKSWTDRDRALYATNLRQFARRFKQLEALAHELQGQTDHLTGEVYSISVNSKSGKHIDRVVSTPTKDRERVSALCSRIEGILATEATDTQVVLAALANLALNYARSPQPKPEQAELF